MWCGGVPSGPTHGVWWTLLSFSSYGRVVLIEGRTKGTEWPSVFFFCDCVFAGLLVGLLLQYVLGRRRCSLLIEPTAWSCPWRCRTFFSSQCKAAHMLHAGTSA